MKLKTKSVQIKSIKNEDEKEHIDSFDLDKNFSYRNEEAIKLRFYGARLKMLIAFYNFTIEGVANACLTNISSISFWTRNFSRPTKTQLRQLSLLFEIPESFFTEPEINIRVNQQFKIIMDESNMRS